MEALALNALARHLLSRQTLAMALALTALICLPAALRTVAPDAMLTLLVPLVLTGVVGGFLVQHPRLRASHAGALFVGGGAVVILVRVGQMGAGVAEGLQQTGSLVLRWILPWPAPAAAMQQLPAWAAAQARLIDEIVTMTQRLWIWLADTFTGNPVDDPAARALALSLLLWFLAGWATWRTRARQDAAGGLLPASFALALTLVMTDGEAWPLWVHLPAFMGLMLLTNLSRLTGSWQQRGMDYSDSVTEDSVLAGILIMMVAMSAAFAASEFSIHDLMERLRNSQPTATAPVAASRGSGSGSGRVGSGAAGPLENVHAITGGPHLSEDIVMYIGTGDLAPVPSAAQMGAPRYYWRGATYDRYTGRGWDNSTSVNMELPADAQLVKAGHEDYRRVSGTVTISAGVQGIVVWTGVLVATDQPIAVVRRARLDTDGNPDVIGATIDGQDPAPTSYRFDSLLTRVNEAALRAAPPNYPDWVRQQYLPLPDSVPERVRALARDLTAQGRTPYDRALAIETYLRQYPYSLDVPAPPAGRDAADYFLFDLKQGYCDYYATAMTVLARAAGLPARLVVGYASGSYDVNSAQYVVREADAHAWTEIYFSGIGWVELEPTSNQPAPAREARRPPVKEGNAQTGRSAASKPLAVLYLAVSRFAWWILGALPALALGWLLVDGLRLELSTPDEAARRAYRRVRRMTRELAEKAPVGQTAREHARAGAQSLASLGERIPLLRRLTAHASRGLAEITDLYMRSVFAPVALTRSEARRVVRLWLGLFWRLALLDIAILLSRREPRQ